MEWPKWILESQHVVTADDGFKVWWPPQQGGFLDAQSLRLLADYLDNINAPWLAQIEEYHAKETP